MTAEYRTLLERSQSYVTSFCTILIHTNLKYDPNDGNARQSISLFPRGPTMEW